MMRWISGICNNIMMFIAYEVSAEQQIEKTAFLEVFSSASILLISSETG